MPVLNSTIQISVVPQANLAVTFDEANDGNTEHVWTVSVTRDGMSANAFSTDIVLGSIEFDPTSNTEYLNGFTTAEMVKDKLTGMSQMIIEQWWREKVQDKDYFGLQSMHPGNGGEE